MMSTLCSLYFFSIKVSMFFTSQDQFTFTLWASTSKWVSLEILLFEKIVPVTSNELKFGWKVFQKKYTMYEYNMRRLDVHGIVVFALVPWVIASLIKVQYNLTKHCFMGYCSK